MLVRLTAVAPAEPEPDPDPELTAICLAEHPRLVGLVALYVGDRHVAEDIAQEALIRLHLHRDRVATESVHAWLATVAMNLARSWWRRRYAELRANRKVGAPTAVSADDGADPADVLAVRDAVLALPPRLRAVVVLRYYAGLSVAQTAEGLGWPEGTVKSATHDAVARLRRAISDDVTMPQELSRA